MYFPSAKVAQETFYILSGALTFRKEKVCLETLLIIKSCYQEDENLEKMNRNVSRESVNSADDGYSSDNVVKTPEKETTNYETQNIEFKQKYLVEKLLNNSANGVIYTGQFRVNSKQTR